MNPLELLLAIIAVVYAVTVFILGFFDLKATGLNLALFLLVSLSAQGQWIILILIGYTAILLVTIFKHKEKEKIREVNYDIVAKRNYKSIIGKVAVPAIAAILNMPGLFISAILFGVADTFANEIGVLSNQSPKLITSLREVKPGTNGGISTLGTIAALSASCLMGIIAIFLFRIDLSIIFVVFAGIIGLSGCMIDSLLGATIENRGIISGWTVNFLSGVVAGLIGNQLFIYMHF